MASKPKYQGGSSNVTPIGLVDGDGNPYFKGIRDANHGSNGGGGDMSDWKASVERRLTELRDDYRELRNWGLAAVGLLLAGGAYAYQDLNSEIRGMKTTLAEISHTIGKIDGRTEKLADGSENEPKEGN